MLPQMFTNALFGRVWSVSACKSSFGKVTHPALTGDLAPARPRSMKRRYLGGASLLRRKRSLGTSEQHPFRHFYKPWQLFRASLAWLAVDRENSGVRRPRAV